MEKSLCLTLMQLRKWSVRCQSSLSIPQSLSLYLFLSHSIPFSLSLSLSLSPVHSHVPPISSNFSPSPPLSPRWDDRHLQSPVQGLDVALEHNRGDVLGAHHRLLQWGRGGEGAMPHVSDDNPGMACRRMGLSRRRTLCARAFWSATCVGV